MNTGALRLRVMLFDARAHEDLLEGAWRPAEVEAEIRTIARGAEEALRDRDWWPVHPLDAEDGDPDAFHGVYLGLQACCGRCIASRGPGCTSRAMTTRGLPGTCWTAT